MERAPFGRTGLEVSPVGLRARGLDTMSREEAVTAVRAALDLGYNWFHTGGFVDADEKPAFPRHIARPGVKR